MITSLNRRKLSKDVMQFKGTWDASTNTPSLVDGVGDIGDTYIVSISGIQFTPIISFGVSDFVIYDGAKWKKVASGGQASGIQTDLTNHINDYTNPHQTKIQNLDDVDLTNINNGDCLSYNGVNFTPAPITALNQTLSNYIDFNLDFNTLLNSNSQIQENSPLASLGDLINGPTLVTGKIGNALYFDGTNQYLDFGYLDRINVEWSNDFSVNLWFKSNSTTSVTRGICGNASGVNTSGWHIGLKETTNEIYINFADSTTTRRLRVRWPFVNNLFDNNWHMLTISKKSGVDQGTVSLYLDGINRNDIKDVQDNNLLKTDSIRTPTSSDFGIARRGVSGNEFNGTLDIFTFFSCALGDDAVKALYNNGLGKENNFDYTSVVQHNHITNDVYGLEPRLINIENQLGTGIQTVNNSDGTIAINNTDAVNPILDLNTNVKKRLGASVPFIYEFQPTILNGSQIGANANIINSVTIISVGWLPINRSLDIGTANYVKNLLDNYDANLPFKIKMVNENNNAEYVTFNITALGGNGADYKIYYVSYIPSETTITNFWANGTKMHTYFLNVIPVVPDVSALEFINKNLLQDASILSLKHSAKEDATSLLYTQNGSLDIIYPLNSGWNLATVFNPLKNIYSYNPNQNNKNNFFAIQLAGPAWTNTNGDLVWITFATESCYRDLSTWATDDFLTAHGGIDSYSQKMLRARIANTTTGIQFAIGTAGNNGVSVINAGNMILTQNDILLCYFEHPTNRFYIEWRSQATGYNNIKSRGYIEVAPTNNIDILFTSSIIPSISLNNRGPNNRVRVLSQRECLSLNLNVPNGECMFY